MVKNAADEGKKIDVLLRKTLNHLLSEGDSGHHFERSWRELKTSAVKSGAVIAAESLKNRSLRRKTPLRVDKFRTLIS